MLICRSVLFLPKKKIEPVCFCTPSKSLNKYYKSFLIFLMTLQSCEDKNLNYIILGLVTRCIIIKKSATNIKHVPGRRGKGEVKSKIYKKYKMERGSIITNTYTVFLSTVLYVQQYFLLLFCKESYIIILLYKSKCTLSIRLHIFC